MLEILFVSLISGMGYFFIYRVTTKTSNTVYEGTHVIRRMDTGFVDMEKVIQSLNAQFNEIKTAFELNKTDSARIIEWLDKRDRELVTIQASFIKNLDLDAREKRMESQTSRIVQLSEQLRLITTRAK